MRVLVVANCQGETISPLLSADPRYTVDFQSVHAAEDSVFTEAYVNSFDYVLAQDIRSDRTGLWDRVRHHNRVIAFPWLLFWGFTPDQMSLSPKPGESRAALDNASRIMACAWARGYPEDQVAELFNPDFIDATGYRSDFPQQKRVLVDYLSKYVADAEYLFEKWSNYGIFFHTSNHPHAVVVEDLLDRILKSAGVPRRQSGIAGFINDPLKRYGVYPNLNHSAATNLLDRRDHIYRIGGHIFSLEEMIAKTYRELNAVGKHYTIYHHDFQRFGRALAAWRVRRPAAASNPYAQKPAHAFWSRSVARVPGEEIPFGAALKPVIGRTTRVATAGSCFAQHVARAMLKDGLNYYVAEAAPADMAEEVARERGYGLFSARYGNIYTARQLVQLIERARGAFEPCEVAWAVKGGYLDPFRPNIGEVFRSVEALQQARAEHLATVYEMFRSLDVFVFTLGLTESWIDRRDGAVYPVAPGAVAKAADPANFEFKNFSYGEVVADVVRFFGQLWELNPRARIVLTVSPVPLIATFTGNDVVTATMYSKSVLRSVAGDVAAQFEAVQYFPSYEIIVGAHNRGAYFEADLRDIRPEGVAHVMSVFRKRLVSDDVEAATAQESRAAPLDLDEGVAEEIRRQEYVVCDEQLHGVV